jgi:23S rRNA pseudouridine1911/1915/1917 synthase
MAEPVVIYEDNHLLVINKPAGWLVQGDKTGDRTLTDWGKDYLRQKYAKPGNIFLHPAHRIDRPVSGAVLFARTDKALSRLTELFRQHAVEKEYHAIVLRRPVPDAGQLLHYLLKDEQKNITKTYDKPTGQAKESLLRYAMQRSIDDGHFLLYVYPQTGRPHQIRAQLSAIGCAIAGDLKYGAATPLPDASIALHCRRMALVHPVKKEHMEVVAEYPANFL